MKKQLFNKFTQIISTLFENYVATYQVCDRDEKDEYFKHYLILIFKDRKPETIYNIKNKKLTDLLDDIRYLYNLTQCEEEEEQLD